MYWYKKSTHGFSSATKEQPKPDAEPPVPGAVCRQWKVFGGGHKWEMQREKLYGSITGIDIEEHNGKETLHFKLRDAHKNEEHVLNIPIDVEKKGQIKMSTDFRGIALRAKNIELEAPVEFSVFVADPVTFTAEGQTVTYTPTYLMINQFGSVIKKAFEEEKIEENGKTFTRYPELPEITTTEKRGKPVRDEEKFCDALYEEVSALIKRFNEAGGSPAPEEAPKEPSGDIYEDLDEIPF